MDIYQKLVLKAKHITIIHKKSSSIKFMHIHRASSSSTKVKHIYNKIFTNFIIHHQVQLGPLLGRVLLHHETDKPCHQGFDVLEFLLKLFFPILKPSHLKCDYEYIYIYI
jgi:hypothetical protein